MFNDTIIYIVDGLGCYGSEPNAQYFKYVSEVSNVPLENIKYKCHKSSSGIKCIVKTYFKSMPLRESRFVYNLVAMNPRSRTVLPSVDTWPIST